MRRLLPAGVAFCLGAGVILSDFVAEPRPVPYLFRPLLVILVLALVVGVISCGFGRIAVAVAAFGIVWIVRPRTAMALVVAGILFVLIAVRLWRGHFVDVQKPLAVAALVFFLVGLVPVVPMISWSSPVDAAPSTSDTPTYLVLLDGYPRPDTLADSGVDISLFLSALEERQFDVYPEATSYHTQTFRTLTHMITGETMPNDDEGSPEERRNARESWSLPTGFGQIAAPYGPVTIPGTPVLNPGGPTIFETVLLQSSIFAWVGGDYAMDGMRYQLNRALDLLADTDQTRIFAHIIAPHLPYLYEGDQAAPVPECWPYCSLYHPLLDSQDAVRRVGLYLEWLNPRILETIDSILAKHADAEIVLFSDHGGRFSESDRDEWHRPFLAARTPTRPGFFAETPHPSSVLKLVRDD